MEDFEGCEIDTLVQKAARLARRCEMACDARDMPLVRESFDMIDAEHHVVKAMALTLMFCDTRGTTGVFTRSSATGPTADGEFDAR